jgi:hypothetical protein
MGAATEPVGIATLAGMRQRDWLPAVLLLSGVIMFGTSSCAPAPPDRSDYEENFQEPDVAPQFFADGTAEENLPYFDETLRTFSIGSAPVAGQPISLALFDAGFDRATVQVSFDESKTQLVADHIFVSARFGDDCLIGQVVSADRTFVTSVQPAIGPEQDICLIGETRPIDW